MNITKKIDGTDLTSYKFDGSHHDVCMNYYNNHQAFVMNQLMY